MKYFLVTLVVFACIVHVQSQDKYHKIDSLLSLYHNYDQLNGAVLVAENGNVLYKKAFGNANFEWSVPNTVDTRFVIGSLTKQFVALMVLQLCQEKKLQVTDPLEKHFANVPADKAKVTIQQLLTHTSGLPHFNNGSIDFPSDLRKVYTREQLLNLAFSQKLLFLPGKSYQYSGFAYHILVCLIEKMDNAALLDIYKKRIFIPAKMMQSTSVEDRSIIEHQAYGYTFNGFQYGRADFRDPSNMAGVGDIITTIEDYFKYDQALRSEILLKQEFKKKFFAPYVDVQGYSWEILKYPRKAQKDTATMVSYTGQISGFNSIAYHCLEDNKLVVIFFNVNNQRMYEIADNLLYISFGRKYTKPKPSVTYYISRQARQTDLVNAVQKYNALPVSEKDKYEHNRNEINALGYSYLSQEKYAEAIALFTANTIAFPEVGDTFDSLGEAYMKSGDKALAVANYKKALALDPNNSNAKEMLRKLEL